jgi:hypothetical protein
MKPYKDWSPTYNDTKGLGCDDRQDWLVLGVMRTRDSGPLDESNFASALKSLGGESDTIEVHRFGHWGPGWFEIILLHPSRERDGDEIEGALADYPVLDDSDHSEREQEAANETWRHCYSTAARIEYIRKHRRQFEFRSLADMLGCVRGKYFAGYASELIN